MGSNAPSHDPTNTFFLSVSGVKGGGKYFRPGNGKFFRPDQQGDDDDSDSEEEDSEEEEVAPKRKAKEAASGANLSSGDEDDDDDEDEDEDDDDEEEEEVESKKRKTSGGGGAKKRTKTSSFFDEEAEASEDDDEDEEDDAYGAHKDPHDVVKKHYTEEDIRREQMDEEAQELIRLQDRRRAQAGRFGSSDKSVAELAREIEDRHRMQRRTVDRSVLDRGPSAVVDDIGGEEGGPVDAPYTAVSQQSLVPSVSDPSLWMVSCLTGKEEELVYQIMNKCIALARQGRPLGITSVVAAQSKGRIYVESYSEPAVLEAIQGIRGLLVYTMQLIPIQDMTTVMTVTPKKKPVKTNDWVRMTRGHYKGDLALVKSVRDSGLKCIVQCVPRIDLTLADLPPEEARIRRRTVRPPQKFFNAQEIAAMGKQSLSRQRFPGLDIFCDYYEGNYYHDGYLLKEMTVGSMVKPTTEEDPPALEELQKFRQGQKSKDSAFDEEDSGENEGSKMAASLLDELSQLQGETSLSKTKQGAGAGLLIGDTIEVVEGDLIGLRGKILGLDGTTVKVKPTNNNIDLGGMEEVEFLANQVRKYIAVGAHVKVTDGRYANETGTVVAVEQMDGETDWTAVVLTDLTNREISVRTSQVRESAEVASGQDKLAGYELYDLVVLSGGGSTNEVGVIVRVGREDFTVVNNHGIVREVRPEELRGKRNAGSNRALAVDVQGNQIRVGDQVSVTEGPHKGKQATIKRMSRTQLFLYSQTRIENAGIFVVRSRSCLLSGSRSQNRGGAGDGGASPFSTPKSESNGAGGGAGGKRDDALIGKTVRIQAGQWKGYLGTVSDATATHVQVELHSRLKKVMVVRERVAVAGDKFGSTEDPTRTHAPVQNISMAGGATPFNGGGATPMHGGATPMHGGATPMHDAGGADEVWRPGGSIDQEPVPSDDGWGSNSNDQSNPFGTSEADNSGGWGSSSGSTWAPVAPSTPMEPPAQVVRQVVKQELDAGDGIAADDGDESAIWFMERVCVQVKATSRAAVIKEINGKTAVIEYDDNTTDSVRVGEVSMVPPVEHNTVLVTGGADVGVEGELVCIDGSDAILKDANEDFKIVDFIHLAKIVGDT